MSFIRKNILSFFVGLSSILFFINVFLVCMNKFYYLTEDIGDIVLNRMIHISLYLGIAYLCLILCLKLSEYFLECDSDDVISSSYLQRLMIVYLFLCIVQGVLYYSALYEIVIVFVPFYIQMFIFIGILIPAFYRAYILNKDMKENRKYLIGLFVLSLFIIMMFTGKLTPIYIVVFFLLLGISILLCIYKYNSEMISKKLISILVILLLVSSVIVVCVNYGNYIIPRIKDYILPDNDIGYYYIRQLLVHSNIVGKAFIMNVDLYREFYIYDLLGASVLYHFGWLCLMIYSLIQIGYAFIIGNMLRQEFKLNKHLSVFYIVLLVYVLLQLLCNITGTLGGPILNITPIFVDVRVDIFIWGCILFYSMNKTSRLVDIII